MIKFNIGMNKFKEKLFSENEEITLHVRGGCRIHLVNCGSRTSEDGRTHMRYGIRFIEYKEDKFSIKTKHISRKWDEEKYNKEIEKYKNDTKEIINKIKKERELGLRDLKDKLKDDFKLPIENYKEAFIDNLKQEYNIIENSITLTAKQISELSKKELEFFYYEPHPPIIYDIHDINPLLDIDPYYLGFWLGDGHACNGGKFTIGLQDQELLLPYMKNYANKLGLKFVDIFDKTKGYAQDFAINSGVGGGMITADYMNEDWEETIINACKKLEISKNTKVAYDNFQSNYDPFKEYLQEDGNYHIGNYSTKSNYKPPTRNGKVTATINQVKQYRFRQYLQQNWYNDILNNCKSSKEVWKDMTDEEKLKWKLCDNKFDIINNTKYLDAINFTFYYKLYEKDREDGIRNYKLERLKSMNTLTIWFNKYNLINNKHIPERYLKGSLSDRKKLFAGLIDSDGYHSPNQNKWTFTQSKKHIRIINDVEKLAVSLGYYVLRSEKHIGTYQYKGEVRPKEAIRLTITPYYNYDIPILLERKRVGNNWTYNGGGNYLKIKNIL
tara:strand:- start:308 stop:1969 length:1662 start_codon:yes stop_codon:yes gene_type:complete